MTPGRAFLAVTLTMAMAVLALTAACGSSDPKSGSGDVSVVTQTQTSTPLTTSTTTPGLKEFGKAPDVTIDTTRAYFATIKTAKGDIRIQLDAVKATQTVNSFVFLAREGYFDGVTFHRVLPGFVAQAGDPTGTGSGGPGYTVPDESNDLKHESGVIAMAKPADPETGLPVPNSARSQF